MGTPHADEMLPSVDHWAIGILGVRGMDGLIAASCRLSRIGRKIHRRHSNLAVRVPRTGALNGRWGSVCAAKDVF